MTKAATMKRTSYDRKMRRFLQALVVVALAPNAFAKAPARTLMTVVTADWTATTGELRRWQRDGRAWTQVGAAVPVVVGKSGLKWPADKREGDGASPAGRMQLGDATGYERAATRLPFRLADASLRCVDDTKSARYNTLAHAPGDWTSDEKMLGDDGLYHYTIFVRHNDARTPGMGSCIFLHVWKDASSPTVGCTAMALDDLRALLGWVTPATVLVQLPREEYEKRQREWGLPPATSTRAFGAGQRK
jgi:zinc D-Ala-D-Ala dipeptidase